MTPKQKQLIKNALSELGYITSSVDNKDYDNICRAYNILKDVMDIEDKKNDDNRD